ncbi:hypothetical protein F1559_003005 [Cyanidiococcus yangmingshanensis]|uniref:High light inducible protein n=1 Tax=Cyanidiococcus yangmingshanensis TaxID=2690220 RepID=A0A7J7IMA7_9RHOD|nr:hypothetical protein F1559_003005 [Cyanidiococcus yangmingshanensis]
MGVSQGASAAKDGIVPGMNRFNFRGAFCSPWLFGEARKASFSANSHRVCNVDTCFCRLRVVRLAQVRATRGRVRRAYRLRVLASADSPDAGADLSAQRGDAGRSATSKPDSSRDRASGLTSGPVSDGTGSDRLERAPGRYKLSAAELAEQRRAIRAVAERYKAERIAREAEARRVFGFCRNAEIINGRTAMFFFATGMLTEYWTGQTMPQQIELLLRILGFLN